MNPLKLAIYLIYSGLLFIYHNELPNLVFYCLLALLVASFIMYKNKIVFTIVGLFTIVGAMLHIYFGLIDHHFHPFYCIEISLLLFTPILMVIPLKSSVQYKSLMSATALTFIGHGLFAIGLDTIPLNFYEMTQSILKLSKPTAVVFLFTAGALDILFAIVLLFRPSRLTLIYMIIWGAITALARFIYGYQTDWGINDGYYWLGQTLVRCVNWLVPLFLLKEMKHINNIKSTH